MKKQLEKIYDPKNFEERIYKEWEEKGYFTPDNDHSKKPFSIVIPPPNVTGHLHMGHALDETLQDILIRYKRMQGFNTLWIPGTDHAGIATQIKVEETLRKEEGLTRHDLGRDEFLKRVWDWKNKYGNTIINQLKKLGCSCDWSRERFTMDEGCSKAVKEVFVNLYNKGLIYRGNKIINWCPHCSTALSDAEVEYSEQDGHFWHIKYPFKDGSGFVTIATTRPETLLGDTAVAVNPSDERYKDLVGKLLVLPLVGREIPVIADEYVEKDFGTGCVKITPAHDPNDFLVGKRHNLEEIRVMNDDATINSFGGKYEGMDRYEARKAIVKDLEELGLLIKTEKHQHNVGSCYRCNTTVEPLTSEQWFVKMGPLVDPALEIVKNGGVKFEPDRFSKIYINWMENLHDWCISRQLWWGHRIPAYYCDSCGEMYVSKDHLEFCKNCTAPLRQEEDVLDTWFSSALWPFSTLGWPEKTEDLSYYYPTSVLVTAYDIIFFWVARMIFSGMEHMNQEPFKHVFIHGLVRDSQGRKMSKSLGNGIDPLEIISEYGADALRFALSFGNSPGNDMRFYTEKVESARNFANKLWNAARFILMNLSIDSLEELDVNDLQLEDKWLLDNYNSLIAEMTENLDKFELGIALSKIYDFIWDIFCDWYIEIVKPRLSEKDTKANISAQKVLLYVFDGILKLLHPFMPFITEEIWQSLPQKGESIMISKWPEFNNKLSFTIEKNEFKKVLALIKAIRNRRSEMNVIPSKKVNIFIKTDNKKIFDEFSVSFCRLSGASSLTFVDNYDGDTSAVSVVTDNAVAYIPLAEMIDFEAEKTRLFKEKEKLQFEIDRLEKKLSLQDFLNKAPEKIILAEKEKLQSYKKSYENVEQSIKKLS